MGSSKLNLFHEAHKTYGKPKWCFELNKRIDLVMREDRNNSLDSQLDSQHEILVYLLTGDAQENFSYENVNKAFQVLINSPKPVLISMGCGRYYKETDGLKIDVGAYTKGLEYACSIKAEYVGKPNPSYFLSAVEQLHLSPEHCVMIGDDVQNDCGAAQKAGLRAVLVRTGKYRKEDEQRTDVKPDGVVDNLLEAVQSFLTRTSDDVKAYDFGSRK